MYAMHYEITLPADYDMQIIRNRVADRGHMTDTFAGLGLKAYLIRERDKAGATLNQYSPFYLWNDTAGMNRFLWQGGGFQGIVESFGRPVVLTWSGLLCQRGPASGALPCAATRERVVVPREADLAQAARDAVAEVEHIARHSSVIASACAIDPRSWERVTFTLWADTPEAVAPGERYEVLHLSRPGFDELAPSTE
ncbi:hypothetical protein OKW45_003399 [Paraburkholderia sp. WSM4175]|uniref:DUF4865 family protein n=1 Tax=Paraburkholderia sp. WSM4175 TaxID=2991072 RepID=UPI003D1AD036